MPEVERRMHSVSFAFPLQFMIRMLLMMVLLDHSHKPGTTEAKVK